ncbi:LamG domain-containing protein [Nonomuraea thailandensis]
MGDGLAFETTAAPGVMTAVEGVRTDASFSVSAWVKLDAAATTTAAARAAVSQDGANFAGFVLWYRPDNGGRWVFGMSRSGDTYKGTDMASSTSAQPGVWTHLTGVYDAGLNQLKLYVNGELDELAGTADRAGAPWHAAGPFRVGQARWSGTSADGWVGAIDEVQLYDRPCRQRRSRRRSARTTSISGIGRWMRRRAPPRATPRRAARARSCRRARPSPPTRSAARS